MKTTKKKTFTLRIKGSDVNPSCNYTIVTINDEVTYECLHKDAEEDKCIFICNSENELKEHIKINHFGSVNKFKCDFCNASLKNAITLRNHIMTAKHYNVNTVMYHLLMIHY